MMIRHKSLGWGLLLALGVLLAAAGAGAQDAPRAPQAAKKPAAPRDRPVVIEARPTGRHRSNDSRASNPYFS